MAKAIVLDNLPAIQLLEDITRETAARVISQLSMYKGSRVALEIFSNGGDVHGSQAVAAYIANPANELQVEARIYGNAASGAMIIASACQKAYIAEGAFALVHKARAVKDGVVIPNEELPKEERAVIDAMNADQVSLFQKRTGMTPNAIEKLMDQDRDMPADEAVEKGFFDGIIPQAMRLAAFKHITMSETPKTVTFKVSASDALKAIASGTIEVPAEQVATADAAKVTALEAEKTSLTAKLADIEAKLAEAETAKTTVETEKAAEVTAKAELETKLAASLDLNTKFQAAIDGLKKNPLVATVMPDGTNVVIPGAEAKTTDYVPTPAEKRSNDAMEAYRKAKQTIQPAKA
jgi:ATP-dependent protease ClpP protease subunit